MVGRQERGILKVMPRRQTADWWKDRTDQTGDCWIWIGYVDKNGYGSCWRKGRTHFAHRAVYETLKGPIPKGLHLDHLCRVTACVNPDHLEPVTPYENSLRSGTFRTSLVCSQCGRYKASDNLATKTRKEAATGRVRMCRHCRNSNEKARKRVMRKKAKQYGDV